MNFLDAYPAAQTLWVEAYQKPHSLDEATTRSRKQAVWRCENNQPHTYVASYISISDRGNIECPYCAGKKLLQGFNDLQTVRPDLAKQWSTKNDALPNEIMFNGNSKHIWECDEGHEWSRSCATIKHVTHGLNDCPYCVHGQFLEGFNDLQTTHPKLVTELHPTKNKLVPSKVGKSSTQKTWWQCDKGHKWQATIAARAVAGTGCRDCSYEERGRRLQERAYGSLLTTYPSLTEEWDEEKNTLTLDDVSTQTATPVWWKCKKGHSYTASIVNRVKGHGKHTKCNVCTNKTVQPGVNDFASLFPELMKQWHPFNIVDPTKIPTNFLHLVRWKEDACGHEWYERPSNKTKRIETTCFVCTPPSYISHPERELADYIQSLLPGETVRTSDRRLLHRMELDIYVPGKNFAVEFNGVYWHSEAHKPKTYHYDKWVACEKKGVQLVQIWEDEWNRNPEQVKRMIAHKLGVTNEPTIGARKTVIVTVPKQEAEIFLNTHHVQGYASGSYYLGLQERTTDQLVALLVLKKQAGNVLNIIRYATACNVPGGFTKLLKHAETTYAPACFLTFSDHSVSDGGLYKNNGFTADKQLKPDYMYVVKGQREHKFNYRLKRFKNDESLLYEEGLTERELASLNKLLRVWDSGKTRWIRPVPSNS